MIISASCCTNCSDKPNENPSLEGLNAGCIFPLLSTKPFETNSDQISSLAFLPNGFSSSSNTTDYLENAILGTLPNVTPQSSSYSFCSPAAKSA